jgi:serine/threonine protein kinase
VETHRSPRDTADFELCQRETALKIAPMEKNLAPRGYSQAEIVGTSAVARVVRVIKDGRSCACRRLTSRGLAEPEARARIATEASVLAALAGRGAPRLVESGDDEAGPFVVWEWAPGETVAFYTHPKTAPEAAMNAAIANREPASIAPLSDAARRAVAQIARASFGALAAVHDATSIAAPLVVVHGDVRPDNVVVADDLGAATLIDFALARMGEGSSSAGGAFAGSPAYAAPEAARGEPNGQPADVFALAMCILELATGKRARDGASLAELVLKAGGAPPVVPHGGEHAAVLDAIRACFSESPEARPRARDVVHALSSLC